MTILLHGTMHLPNYWGGNQPASTGGSLLAASAALLGDDVSHWHVCRDSLAHTFAPARDQNLKILQLG
jgi:hypothetical protein